MSALERLLLEHSEQMILLVEPDSLAIVLANRVAAQTLGYSEDELLAKTILDVECSLQDVFYWEEVRSGQYADIAAQECLYLCADGSMRSATKSIKAIADAGRRYLLIQARETRDDLGVAHDLAQATSQLRATLESTGNGILVIDWHGQIASMNRLFSAMWRLPEDLLLRQDDAAILDYLFVQLEDASVCRSRLREIVDDSETEDIFRLRDGRVFACKSLPQYLDERIIGRVFGFSDISERIRIEHDLIAARERAEAANGAKAAFLAMMSHEIRTPMNGVMGMTALLADTRLDAEQRRYLDIIRSSSEALLGIINDVLDFSKIEAHKLALEHIDFDLLALIEDLADLNALRAGEKGLDFVYYLDPAVPTRLRGDPGRIRQILTNLIGNSLKFTSVGTISLQVTLAADYGERLALRFEVADTGIGIAPANLARIFAPFEQADTSTTRQYGGTGLGLAITKQLVDLMAGNIRVDSEEGRGTTFHVGVVVVKQAAGTAAAAELPGRSETGPGPLRGVPVLAVDANPIALRNVLAQLATLGLTGAGAADADEAGVRIAAAAAAGTPFRCALVATAFDADAAATLAARLQRAASAATPLIACVPAGSRGAERAFAAAGFAARLHRPVRRAELAACLRQVLGTGASVAPAAPPPVVAPRSARLLVVEDNAVNMLVMKGVLGKLGYRDVASAGDGEAAVKAVLEGRFDLVLMDCQMPKMDGYEATRRLREAGLTLPIIAMTAHTLAGDREKCLSAGMDDYLTKPIVVGPLADCLDAWLQRPCASAPATIAFQGDDFLALLRGDRRLAATLLEMFVTNMPGDLARLKAAIDGCDATQAAAVAHFIKGAVANLCAPGIGAAVLAIEEAAARDDIAAAGASFTQLEQAWRDFLADPQVADRGALVEEPGRRN